VGVREWSLGMGCRSDGSRGEEGVDAAAAAEVEDGLAFVKLGQQRRIAAAERGDERLLGQPLGLGAVEIGGDGIGAARFSGAGGFGVLGANGFFDYIHVSEYVSV